MQDKNLVTTLAKVLSFVGGGWGVLLAWITILQGNDIPLNQFFYGLYLLVPLFVFLFFKNIKRFNFPEEQLNTTPMLVSGLLGGIGGTLLFIAGFILVKIVIQQADFEAVKELLFDNIGLSEWLIFGGVSVVSILGIRAFFTPSMK